MPKQRSSLTREYPVFPAPFVKSIVFLPWNDFGILIKSELIVNIRIALQLSSMASTIPVTPEPHHIGYSAL